MRPVDEEDDTVGLGNRGAGRRRDLANVEPRLASGHARRGRRERHEMVDPGKRGGWRIGNRGAATEQHGEGEQRQQARAHTQPPRV